MQEEEEAEVPQQRLLVTCPTPDDVGLPDAAPTDSFLRQKDTHREERGCRLDKKMKARQRAATTDVSDGNKNTTGNVLRRPGRSFVRIGSGPSKRPANRPLKG